MAMSFDKTNFRGRQLWANLNTFSDDVKNRETEFTSDDSGSGDGSRATRDTVGVLQAL